MTRQVSRRYDGISLHMTPVARLKGRELVQHLLGHASITMTLDRYSHWIPSMGRHAAEGMDEALGQFLLLTYC
jgi:integrase